VRRLYKSLLWAAVLEALAWIILRSGPPLGGLHNYIFILMHFVPAYLCLVAPVFSLPWLLTTTQFLFWTVFVYLLYAAIEGCRNAKKRKTEAQD
jgi:hypothetical protein